MVDINLLPDNLREREEKARREAAKQPHEPDFALTNPPPLKPPPVRHPAPAKPSAVTRAAQAAPPLPQPPPLPAAAPPRERPKPPTPPTAPAGPLHAAPKAAADAAHINLLRTPTPPSASSARAAAEPAAATAAAEAMLSAAVKRELARSPVAIPPLPSRRRRGLWAWLRSLFRRHPHEQLPPVPKVVLVPPPAKPKVPVPPSPRPAPAVPVAAKVALPPVPTPPLVAPAAVTPATVHPPVSPPRAKRHWWPWRRRPRTRVAHPPAVALAKVTVPPPSPAPAKVHLPVAPKRGHRSFWAWLQALLHRHPRPRPPKLPPAPAVVLSRPTTVPKPPVSSVVSKPAAAATPVPPVAPSPAKAPAPAAVPAPGKPAAPTAAPRSVAPSVGAPLRITPGQRGHPGAVGRPVRTLAVNLIPSDLSVAADQHLKGRLIGLGVAVLASALVVVGLQQWVRWYQVQIGTQVKATEEQITQLTAAIAGYEQYRLEGDALQTQIKTVEAALARHLYWTKIFEKLEQYTLPEVYYTSFTASEDGSLILAAVGKDYQSVARQLVAFQEAKDFVASVTITSASADYDTLPPGVVAELRRTAPPDTAVAAETITATHFQVALTLLPDVYRSQFVTQRAP